MLTWKFRPNIPFGLSRYDSLGSLSCCTLRMAAAEEILEYTEELEIVSLVLICDGFIEPASTT